MDLGEYKEMTARREYIPGGSPAHELMHGMSAEAQKITSRINCGYHTQEELRELFSELIGKEVGEGFALFPPVYSDFGKNITVGKNVFINSGCCFQDQGGVELGDGTLVGHQVVFASLNHDLDPDRRAGMYPALIKTGRNVWIGSHATLLSGVSEGDYAVIEADAGVTIGVRAYTVRADGPARGAKAMK